MASPKMTSASSRVQLSGVPETMLWTLHNRASEAKRPDRFLDDPACVRLYDSIAYDYRRRFGRPNESHPMRSRLIDDTLRPWLAAHPRGMVIELGAGLETQFQRCDDGRVHWLCVDVPEAIEVRARLLPASDRCRYVAISALDLQWLEEVESQRDLFVTAQGLFMYFPEADVRHLVTAIVDRFPGVELMFDAIPRWLSARSLKQEFRPTPVYTAPPMPWGVSFDEIEPLLRSWSPAVDDVRVVPYGVWRGAPGLMVRWCVHLRWLRNRAPSLVHVRTRRRTLNAKSG